MDNAFNFIVSNGGLQKEEDYPYLMEEGTCAVKKVIKDFVSGEIKQASSLFDCDVELEDYLIKSYYKTASLLAASTKRGQLYSAWSTVVSVKACMSTAGILVYPSRL